MADKNQAATKTVITRFAPSPTGFLHIGGARTALFNWLYAKANGGKMLLRIEDTDRERSTDEAVTAILDGLSWLGLTWDDEVVSQYANAGRHRQIAEQLVKAGKAYHCFSTAEELEAMREKARAEGSPPRYDGRWRDRDPAEASAGAKSVIRIKAPQTGETIIDDRVQGEVRFANKDLDDFVLLRSDGNPTYMLAVVVDDHDVAVSHIIRGDDHLTNAARQSLIYQAMGWDMPVMAHIPLIHGADGAKMSKRHGALGADAYRAMGILPEALRNYLVRLGWAHGDDEIISTEQMLAWFDFGGMGKAAARFDMAKLEALNGQYIRHADDLYLVSRIEDILPELNDDLAIKHGFDAQGKARLTAAMPGLKERAKTLVELADSAHYLFAKRPLELQEKAAAILADGGSQVLAGLLPALEAVSDWSLEALESTVRGEAERTGLNLGKIAQPLRAALTGRTTSPGIFDVLAIMGKNECLARIKDHVATEA